MKKSTTLITVALALCTGSTCIAQSTVQSSPKAQQVQMTEYSKEIVLQKRIARQNTTVQKSTLTTTLRRDSSDEKAYRQELDKRKLKEIEEQKEKQIQMERKTEINGDNKEKAKDSSKETHK